MERVKNIITSFFDTQTAWLKLYRLRALSFILNGCVWAQETAPVQSLMMEISDP